VNRNLLREFDLTEDLLAELDEAFGAGAGDWLPPEAQKFEENQLLTGRVLRVTADAVWVDVGYKSEGSIELREWYDEGRDEIVPPRPGDEIQLLLLTAEDESGAVVLSYRKARWQREWEEFLGKHKEGEVVSGPVTRKIKGGLLVNIGVNAF